ncbi:MAG: hypothetical protein U0359_03185 [Byssovorax sp.]
MTRITTVLCLTTLLFAGFACGTSSPTGGTGGAPPVVPTPAPAGEPYDTLGEWHLFADGKTQAPAEGVIPYDVNAPLFSDYTQKRRFLWVPKGQKIGWKDKERWDFPLGTIMIKTFAYPVDARDATKGERLLETRLLVHEGGAPGWTAHTYVWNEDQTEAKRVIVGQTIPIDWIDEQGKTRHNDYAVPNTNICQECHGKYGVTNTLGGRTRQLERAHDYGEGEENQIDHLAALGLFDAAPPPSSDRQKLIDPFGSGPIGERGRSYLDANCSHCHGVVGLAKGTAFWLDYDRTDPAKGNPTDWGVCKVPASAGGGTCGLGFDVVPGHSDQSIVVCRTGSLDAKVAMPPVGHRLIHDEGVQLLKDWIDAMPEQKCQ